LYVFSALRTRHIWMQSAGLAVAAAFGVGQLVGAFARGTGESAASWLALAEDSGDRSPHSKRWRDCETAASVPTPRLCDALNRYGVLTPFVFSVVGTSRCDVRAACSGATSSNASVARIFVPPATTRAGTAQRAIPTIAVNTYLTPGYIPHGTQVPKGRQKDGVRDWTSVVPSGLATFWRPTQRSNAGLLSAAPAGLQQVVSRAFMLRGILQRPELHIHFRFADGVGPAGDGDLEHIDAFVLGAEVLREVQQPQIGRIGA